MRNLLFVVAIFILAIASPARAKLISGYPLEDGWAGGSYTYEDNNRFSHCAASAPYRNGTVVYVSIDENYSWYLGFSNESWRLKRGRKVPIVYRFDQGMWFEATGEARDKNFFTVSMPPDSTLIDLFRRGELIGFEILSGALSFGSVAPSVLRPRWRGA